jgi:phage portal protein BeeE
MPPRYVGLPSGDSSTYATARDNDAALMRFGLAGYVDGQGEALSSLLPPGRNESEDETVRNDTDALLRGTILDRITVWDSGLSAGWLTVDEVRQSEGLDPLAESGARSLPVLPGQVSA